MALLQISEPGQSPDPHQRRRAVGIDLGTTNSLVATVRGAIAEALEDHMGHVLLPSIVHYGDEGVSVGRPAKAMLLEDSQNTIASAKRLMGRGFNDSEQLPYDFVPAPESGMPLFRTRLGNKSPIEVSAEILLVLRERAEEALGGDIDGAVITVPAYFDDAQRQATKDAAQLAGLNVLRLINEPTAAALAYGLDKGDEGVIAVYDLGGGTFDVSVLRLHLGVFEVLATGGDSALGGDDFDRAIVSWLIDSFQLAESKELVRQLLPLAREAKETLSVRETATVTYGCEHITVDRDTLKSLITPLIQQTLLACRRALRDAGVGFDDVDNVVLVGGSTRVPLVREAIADLFGKAPLATVDPDKVVAIGAAQQADILVGNKPDSDVLLLDVIPLSLGIETMGGLNEKIIHRNTTIPVTRAQEFTTYKDGQTAMAIHVVQGERDMVSDNRSLARFELRGIPPLVAGAAHIKVTFQIDADGLLSVSAREESSGVEANVAVKPSYGLSDNEVATMIKESFSNAAADKDARELREQQVEAQRMIESVESALALDGDSLLNGDEIAELEFSLAELSRLADEGSSAEIAKQVDLLARQTEEFAARRMNASIKRALAGHKVEDFE